MRNIVVESYNPDWPRMFSEEAKALRGALGPAIEEVHHVGSTSVAGLSAKPVIDILIVTPALSLLDECNEQMVNLGYEPKGEFGITGRRFYSKGTEDRRTHHVHAYERDHAEVTKHLQFRDFLIRNPDEARRYAEVKLNLAELHPNDIDSYIAGKSELISEMIGRALK